MKELLIITAAATVLDLITLEVLLVLDDFDERHGFGVYGTILTTQNRLPSFRKLCPLYKPIS
jgi:hypothetical protein